MELIAYDQAGDLLACGCGCSLEGQHVLAGLLYVREGVTIREHVFVEPQTEKTILLRLPEKALNLLRGGQAIDATLEIP